MENTINALIFVAGILAAVYFANYTRTEASGKREQKSNDIFTFLMPFITALALGILLIDFYYLPVVITAALAGGSLALLISWTSEHQLNSLPPYTQTSKVSVKESTEDEYRSKSSPLPLKKAPERLKKLLSAIPKEFEYAVNCHSQGGFSSRLFASANRP